MVGLSQFISIIGYGRVPSNGAPEWSCITGITREGARAAGACNHLRNRAAPVIIYGTSPVEAGQRATERADHALDNGKRRRRLRPNGWALLAGVASYPVPREVVEADPAQKRRYRIWKKLMLRFLDSAISAITSRAWSNMSTSVSSISIFTSCRSCAPIAASTWSRSIPVCA